MTEPAFTDATTGNLPVQFDATGAVALGDVDGDGDEAIIGNDQVDRLLTNLTRQTARRGQPRVGQSLTIDVHGTPDGVWGLVVSLAQGSPSITLPPYGAIRVDPATAITVAGGPPGPYLDPQGQAWVSIPVPNVPGLIGGKLYWQALVGTPLRLTNLEITTFQ